MSKHLLESVGRLPQSVRLLGVRADHLQESTGSVQLTIDRQDENWRKVEKSLDEVWTKFGAAGLTPARLLHRAAPPEESRRDQEE